MPDPIKVNRKRCRNCVYGPEPFASLELRNEAEEKLDVVLCHNSPVFCGQGGPQAPKGLELPRGAVVCRGYYDKCNGKIEHMALVRQAMSTDSLDTIATSGSPLVTFVDCPDVKATVKPDPVSTYTILPTGKGDAMSQYDGQVAKALKRSRDRQARLLATREARKPLIAQGAQELFRIVEEQSGTFTVTSVRKPEDCGEHFAFGLSLADPANQLSYDISATVSYGDNFDEVNPRFLRAELRIVARHPAVADQAAVPLVFIVHWDENGAVAFDLSAALVEVARRLPVGAGQPLLTGESSEGL
jgi:hypothetical protein